MIILIINFKSIFNEQLSRHWDVGRLFPGALSMFAKKSILFCYRNIIAVILTFMQWLVMQSISWSTSARHQIVSSDKRENCK